MRLLRHFPAIEICGHRAGIAVSDLRLRKVLYVIAHRQHHLVRDQLLPNKVKDQAVGHLLDDQASLVHCIWQLKHLTDGYGIIFRLIALYGCDCTRLPAPGMIDQQLRVHAEDFIQQVFVVIVGLLPY